MRLLLGFTWSLARAVSSGVVTIDLVQVDKLGRLMGACHSVQHRSYSMGLR